MYDRPSLQEEYDTNLKRWLEVYDKVGTQFLASGSASTKDIDGNSEERDEDDWYSYRHNVNKSVDYERVGQGKVVIDIFKEKETKDRDSRKDKVPTKAFWLTKDKEQDSGEAEWDGSDDLEAKIPIHPYVVIFDLQRHLRMRIHVGYLSDYVYDDSMREKLIMPESSSNLIDVLMSDKGISFHDIVKGKTGGMVIICQGPPGTGKTLTAEVYAEAKHRALYTIQCSQLGTDEKQLEKNLTLILRRGRRWNAVTLLDEADVYVHKRGNDLTQNAIVGVFLRVLEYQAGVLFLTTNRGDMVDDAVLSRCTARIPYTVPDATQQHKIWSVLAETNGITLAKKQIREIVDRHHNLSGRDIKNLLKLSSIVAHDRGCEIDADLITEMKQFKPTHDQMEE